MFTIRMAEKNIQVNNKYGYIKDYCKNYIVNNVAPDFIVEVSDDEILAEKSEEYSSTIGYLETLAVYRKICERLVVDNIILVHSSVLMVDGQAVMFLAPSGTGKSTHSRLWRQVVEEVAKDYPEVSLEHMLVDNCAMQLVKDPAQFDVILTENMFGDILSDEASMITGSIGMLASASLNDTKFGLYEPSHGSAPDIAGKDIANPIATVLSATMMLRFSFDLDREAAAIERAVKAVLQKGYRTVDIMSEGCSQVGCKKMGDLLADEIQ